MSFRPPVLAHAPSLARRKLLDVLRQIDFGRVANLKVRGGEPAFDRDTVTTRTVKLLGTAQSPRRPVVEQPTGLERSQALLLDQLDRLGDGTVARIEVAHGLPSFIEVEHRVVA